MSALAKKFDAQPNHTPVYAVSSGLIISCLIGNMLEFYEFAMFGYLTAILAPLFFPAETPFFSLMLTYLAFACGFLMRPVGALFLGYIGDTYGRKQALLVSLIFMAVPTIIIGLLPTYEHIGVMAPVLMILCRLFQGLSLGGEFTGSIIFLMENAPHHRRGFYSSWADFGSSLGMILASCTIIFLNMALTAEQMSSWGWRLPFLTAVALGIIGLVIRKALPETVDFLSVKNKKRSYSPLKELLKGHLKPLFYAATFMAINASGYYLLIIYIPAQNAQYLPSLTISLMTLLNLLANIPGYFSAAYLSDKIGQVPCLIAGSVGCILLAYPMVCLTGDSPLHVQILCQMLFSLSLGVCYGPRSSFAAKSFPTHIRYSGVSFSYSIANALFGGTAPIICAYLTYQTGLITAPAFYVMALTVLSIISVILLHRHHQRS